jgi:catechol 2,3-dioxygenase-like lactoylglutathione lyase family enzyme
MNNTPPAYVLDHVGLAVTDLGASRDFYQQALAPLGFAPVVELENPPVIAFGLPTMPQLWIHEGKPTADVHVAFHAEDRERVDAFHEAGISAGGRDNGAPGLRPHYHPGYYAAYLLDPDGNNVEAVCHTA